MIDRYSQSLLHFHLIEPAKHKRRRERILRVVSDIEWCTAPAFLIHAIADILGSFTCLGADFVGCGYGAVVVWIGLEFCFAAFAEVVEDAAGFVEFVHAPFVIVLRDGLDAVGVVVREDNFRFEHVRGVDAAVDDT